MQEREALVGEYWAKGLVMEKEKEEERGSSAEAARKLVVEEGIWAVLEMAEDPSLEEEEMSKRRGERIFEKASSGTLKPTQVIRGRPLEISFRIFKWALGVLLQEKELPFI